MKSKTKLPRRMKPATDKRVSEADAHTYIDHLLREEDAPSNRPGVPLGTIMQTTPSGEAVFRLSLLRRAQCGNDRTTTEIERRFREEAVQTYTPESIAEEIALWGIPRRILEDARRDPDDAENLRILHAVFPGAIFGIRETLDSITRHAVATLVSNDASTMKYAKRWLSTVLFVHRQKGRHAISLGVRHLGLFPYLYEETVFLKNVARILRKQQRFASLGENKFIESVIPLLSGKLDIPSAGKAKEWLRNIISSASQKPAFKRPITAAAEIIASCTQSMHSGPSGKDTGYRERSIRKTLPLIHSDWAKQQGRIEKAAKNEAAVFCMTI